MKKLVKSLLAIAMLSYSALSSAALIEIFQDGSGLTNISDADALIAGTTAVYTGSTTFVNFNDNGDGNGQHGISPDDPWPGVFAPSNFAARITGTFAGPMGELADFRIGHDDGVRMTINGSTVEFPGLTDDRNSFLNGLVLQAINTIEIVFFERFGGASLELTARCSVLTDNCDATNYFLLALDDPQANVPAPGGLILLGLGLLGFAARRRQIA